MTRNISVNRLSIVFVFTALLLNVLAPVADGQTRRPSRQASAASSQPKCTGGWSGTVTFKKTLKESFESDEPGIRKNIDRIKHRKSRDYDYTANAVVDGKNPQSAVVNTNISFKDTDLQWGEERVFDTCNSRENGHWFIIEGTDDRQTTATATGSARSFHLHVDEISGTYSFSLAFPDAIGTYRREHHVKRSGHCQPKNNEPYDKSENNETRVEGESFSVDSQRIDPNDPDTISGSKTWGDDGTGRVRTFVYTATWTFTRCPESLLVTDIKFEDMRVPDWNAWKEVTENQSTIDGNIVRITAKVLNLSGETKYPEIKLIETYKGDKWDGAKKDRPLDSSTVRLEPGEEREVEWIWNSQGYAWYNDGRPRLVQRMRVEAWDNNKLKDSRTENIRVAPKPIVFVAGIWSSPQSFEIYQNILTISHSYDWKAAVFTRSKPRTSPASVYDNADDLAEFVKSTQKKHNAWHVDMVAHSTGGLVGRLYIHKQMEVLPDNKPVVKHFLMLGTPNLGVPCADSMKYNDAFAPNMRTAQEIMPEEMVRFNQFVTERKGTNFSALIGNGSQMLCASWEPSDGFVSVESARWLVKDFDYTSDPHPDLVDQKHFGGFMKKRLVTGPMATYPLFPGVLVLD